MARFTNQEPKKIYYIKSGNGDWYYGPYVNPPKGHPVVLCYDLTFNGIINTRDKQPKTNKK